jgi:DNA-directed RNA polymerase subunit RPC12/RpoP
MSFQFTCPQGHLLEGDESQAGQQCQCPTCGMLFIIPHPVAGAAPDAGLVDAALIEDPFAGAPGIETPQEPRLLHIPCPNGHELETPEDMLGQEVLCPHCGAQFVLREQDSLEAQRLREIELDRRLREQSNAWFNWAIVISVLVGLALVGLVLYVNR